MNFLAKFLLLIFGLSVAGYVLLDGGHELLHTLKTNLHQHKVVAHNHSHFNHGHHHVEDHQQLFISGDHGEREKKSSVQISYFFFYFQQPIKYILAQALDEDFKTCLFNKFINLSIPPFTPPPLAAYIV